LRIAIIRTTQYELRNTQYELRNTNYATRMKKIFPFAPALVWGIFIFGLSVWPGKDFPTFDWEDLLSLDKIVHITFYAVLTGLILRGVKLSQNNMPSLAVVLATAAFSTAYGWFLEWLQENYCQDRMFDVLDGVANTIGAFGVGIVYSVLNRKR
jgi:VanZ family protein